MILEILLKLILCVTLGNSSATLEVDPAMARDRPSFITCTTSNQITRGINFLSDDSVQGGCFGPGVRCNSTVQGYSVTQNVTARITTLVIDSVNCTRETGSWNCAHGADPYSPAVYIGCNTTKYAPSIDKSRFPSTFIAVKGRQLSVNCASYTKPGLPSNTSYTWTHPNGSSTSGSTLQVNNVDTSDAGQYTCRASNNFSSSQQGQDSATLHLTVQFAPTVSGQNPSYPVRELFPLNIDCRTYTTAGNPPNTSYKWTGPNSFSSPQHILSISSISRNQAGIYTCRATNTLTPTGGSTESGIGEGQFSVDVQYKPSVSGFPDPFYVTENTDLSLNCSSYTQSNPEVTSYRWTGPGGYSSISPLLSISSINRDKTGDFTCTATNSIGTGTGLARINVQYKPSVSGFPDPFYITEHKDLSLECSSYTQSNPAVTSYGWTGPGGYSSVGPVLSISSINRDKTGHFTCTATNTLTPSGGSPQTGTGSLSLTVRVQYAPQIQLQQSMNVTESSPLNINCSQFTTLGEPISTRFQWSDPNGFSSSGPILFINNIQRGRAGNYTCTASNTLTPTGQPEVTGSDTDSVNIHVLYGPGSSVSISPQTMMERVEGSGSVTVTCSADCFPPCSFKWMMGNKETESHQLHFANVSRTDGGSYSCEAWNGVGDRARRDFVLDVFYLDVPVLSLNKTEVRENDTVEMSCEVVSNPTVRMVIENIDNRTELVNKLTNREDFTVQHARCLHNGVYRCTANNQKTGSSLYASKTLSVLCSPRPDFRVDLIRTVSSELNQSVRLNATFIANPAPSFSWYRVENDGRAPIGNQTVHKITNVHFSTSLQINLTHTRDYSDYAAVAENDFGNDSIKYTLTTSGPPYPPLNPVVTQLGSTFLGFEWISDYNSGQDQTFQLEFRTSHSSEWKPAAEVRDPGLRKTVQTNLTDLSPSTTYHIRLYSKNQFGTSDSIFLNATTLPGLDRTEQAFDSGLAAGAGVGCAVLVILIVVVVIVVLKKRRQRAEDGSKIALHGRNRDAPEMCENEIYEGAGGATGIEKPVMEDNVLYAGGPANEPQGATEYAAVMKKGPTPKNEKENVSDVYATPVKKRGKDKVKEKVKDKKGGKQRKRGDVYENTVPGQFSAGFSSDPDANTYANAAFVNDENQVATGNPKPPTGRDADGCLYVGIDFGNQKPGKVIIGDEKSPYADIAFGRVGPPPAPDEDEEKKKETASK